MRSEQKLQLGKIMSPKLRAASVLAFGFVFAAAGIGLASEDDLYETPPPSDAVFLRWIEPEPAPEILGIQSPDFQSGVFHAVSAGQTEGANAGDFYTAAVDEMGNLVVIKEPERADRSKVTLILLNLTDGPVKLVLTEQNVDVIGATEVHQAAIRAVNPVSASLSVVTSDGTELGSHLVQLRRGQNVTFVARTDSVQLLENKFGPNLGG